MESRDITYLRIEHYSGHPEVAAAAELLVDKYAESVKYIRKRNEWINAAKKLIASLWIREGDKFRFSTKKDYFSKGNRKQVWLTPKTLKLFKTMLALDWIVKVQEAIPPKYSNKATGGMATIYCRRKVFKDLLKSIIEQDIELDEEMPLVTLTNKNGQYVDLPDRYLTTDSYKSTVDILNKHYQLLKSCVLKDINNNSMSASVIRYRRRFTRDMGNGGRIYSPFCNMPKRERLGITIDDELVGSLDFSQLHPTLILLMQRGIGFETGLLSLSTGDVYSMPDYPELSREAHKKFINTILNAETLHAAVRSIATAEEYWDIIEDRPAFITYSGKKRRLGNPVWPEQPKKNARKYVSAFLFRHPNFIEAASSKQWGFLQLIDSSIIVKVLEKATQERIPVLPIHDEIVLPRRYKDVVKQIMIDAFHDVTFHKFSSHTPKIKYSELPLLF